MRRVLLFIALLSLLVSGPAVELRAAEPCACGCVEIEGACPCGMPQAPRPSCGCSNPSGASLVPVSRRAPAAAERAQASARIEPRPWPAALLDSERSAQAPRNTRALADPAPSPPLPSSQRLALLSLLRI